MSDKSAELLRWVERARALLPKGQLVTPEQFISGMIEAGASDSEWRYGLEALITAREARYTDQFDIVRGDQ